MNFKFRFFKFIFPSVSLFAVVFLVWQFPAKIESANKISADNEFENYDIRTVKTSANRQIIEEFIRRSNKTPESIELDRQKAFEAEKNLRERTGSLKVEKNETLNIPEVISPEISGKTGFLTPPNNAERNEILRAFLRQNSALFGLNNSQISALKTSANYTNPNGELSFVHFEQKIGEVSVFQGEVKAGFTKRGEIIRIINNLTPNITEENVNSDFGNPQNAVINAAKNIGIPANENDVKIIDSNNLKFKFERGQFSDHSTAEKFYFPIASGVIRPAWRVFLWTETNAFYVIVDAEDGTLLWRKNLTESQTLPATYNVYGNSTGFMKTQDSPVPFTPGCVDPNNCILPMIVNRQTFTLVGNEPPYTFNNLGWIPDTGLPVRTPADPNVTDGNNVEAGIDRVAPNGVDAPTSGNPSRVFNFNYNPYPGNPPPGENPLMPEFQNGAVTQGFYAVNRWHDEMYLLGFTEQAGNFQHFNFNRGGSEGDRVSLETQDSSGFNGANMAVPADGNRPRLQMFIWNGTTPNKDGVLDSQILIHEISHGTSSRLHGNATGLGSNMARGMSEGVSDFYALALLSAPEDNIFGTHSVGCYASSGLANFNCYYGLRRFPTAIKRSTGANNFPYNPLTFGNLNAGNCSTFGSAFPPNQIGSSSCDQVHNMGEIWNSALWEARAYLIEKHGATVGNRRILQYVTDGMKLSPLNPTLIQSRDAILIAASISNPGDLPAVWRGFAVRGMGFSASIQNAGTGNNNAVVTEAFNLPNSVLSAKRADFDGDGKSDLSVFRPTEGNWYLNNSANGFSVINWGISTDVPVPGDFDSDNKTDIAVFRPNADGNLPDFYILNSSNFTFSGYSWGLPDDVPVVEDYDGDEKSDIAVFRPSNGTFYVLQSSNGIVLTYSRALPGFRPVAGDFDGDGKGDFAYFNHGNWLIAKSINNYTSGEIVFWGLNSDKLVPADYDGDGIVDVAVYRPSDGVWYIRKSSGGTKFVQFGILTDVPVPGDFDGDGIYDIAVYRNGIWYINNSTAGIQISQFGSGGDLPIPDSYLP